MKEYAKIFLIYNGFNEFDVLENVVAYERIAESKKIIAELESKADENPVNNGSENTLLKRPTIERDNSFDQYQFDNITVSNHDLTKVD